MKFIYVEHEGYISVSLVKRAEPCMDGVRCQLWADFKRTECIGFADLAEFERITKVKPFDKT